MAGVTHNITMYTSVKNARYYICLNIACIFSISDKGLAKVAEGASPRRHAENSPVKVKDTHLMNNKLPPAEILSGECVLYTHHHFVWNIAYS